VVIWIFMYGRINTDLISMIASMCGYSTIRDRVIDIFLWSLLSSASVLPSLEGAI